MSFVSKIEQKVIFNITRCMALVVIGLLFVSIILGVIFFFNVGKENQIAYADIEYALNPTSQSGSESIQEVVPQIEIPEKVEKYLGAQNKTFFLGWIRNLDPEKKQDFVDNLSEVISQTEIKSPDKMIDFINKYKELKLARFATDPYGKYTEKAMKAGAGIFILATIGLVGLFSLILVLLAVERNTRKEGSTSNC